MSLSICPSLPTYPHTYLPIYLPTYYARYALNDQAVVTGLSLHLPLLDMPPHSLSSLTTYLPTYPPTFFTRSLPARSTRCSCDLTILLLLSSLGEEEDDSGCCPSSEVA